jgi:hypothetical protein
MKRDGEKKGEVSKSYSPLIATVCHDWPYLLSAPEALSYISQIADPTQVVTHRNI